MAHHAGLTPMLALAVALTWGTSTREAAAEEAPSTATLDKARENGLAGIAALNAGDFGEARARCEAALKVVQAPPVALCRARALRALGLLVSAREAFQALAAQNLAADAPEAWRKAVADAAGEEVTFDALALVGATRAVQDELAKGFAQLSGGNAEAAAKTFSKVLQDDASLPPALLGRALARAALGERESAEQDLASLEKASGSRKDLGDVKSRAAEVRAKWRLSFLRLNVPSISELELAIDAEAPSHPKGDVRREIESGVHTVRVAAPGHTSRSFQVRVAAGATTTIDVALMKLPPVKPLAWASLGVGVVGLGVAGGLFGAAADVHSGLVKACPELKCGKTMKPEVDKLDALRSGTWIAGGIGAAAAIASGILFIVAPTDKLPEAPSVGVGLGTASFTGRF